MTGQLSFADQLSFDQPKHRATDRDTSRAAPGNEGRLSAHRWAALCALVEGDATDFELAERTGVQQTSIGKRRLELVRDGLACDTSLRRPSPTGSLAIVWTVTPAGYRYWQAHR